MHTAILIISDAIVLFLSVLLVTGVISMMFGLPRCIYAFLVSKANTKSGIEDLAKYLAKKTHLSNGKTDDIWQLFIPTAEQLGKQHQRRRHMRTFGFPNQ